MKNSFSEEEVAKKIREKELIGRFVQICPEFREYKFFQLSENPDMIYKKDDDKMGFESVIISDDQASVDCYYDPIMCKINLPTKIPKAERKEKIIVFFENKLFKHFRRYEIPTILVFSLVDTEPTTFDELVEIAKKFRLPEFNMFNIVDYYVTDGNRYVKIAES